MRRRVLIEPATRAGRLSPYLAWFGLCVALGGLLLSRAGMLQPTPPLAVIGAGWVLSGLGLIAGCVGLAAVWRRGCAGVGASFHGVVIACVALAWPALVMAMYVCLPHMADVSTDAGDPPQFSSASGAVAARDGWSPQAAMMHERFGDGLRGEGYAVALPLYLDRPPARVYDDALASARKHGWRIGVEQRDPAGGGQFEARALSRVLRLPEYVIVRVRPTADGALVDMRSASSLGDHDLGSNARRILEFYSSLPERTQE